MKTVILVFVALVSLYQPSVARSGPDCHLSALRAAVRTRSISLFLKTINALDRDSTGVEGCKDSRKVLQLILRFHVKLLQSEATDSLFVAHVRTIQFLEDNAEYSELLNENFSAYFMRGLRKSLIAMDSINDLSLLRKIAQSASFTEGNGTRILKYMRLHGLQDKAYYKYFVEFK